MVAEHSNNEPRRSQEPAGSDEPAEEVGEDTPQDSSREDNSLSDESNETGGAPRLYKTGEVLAESGISRQMLYRYIQMDLVVPAETTKTGRNLFSDRVFKQIKMIQQLNERYTLQNIREIFSHRLRQL